MGLILPQEVEVKLYSKNIGYYENLGYFIPRKNNGYGRMTVPKDTYIKVSVLDLPRYSETYVKVYCDNCREMQNVKYYSYMNSIEKTGSYYCKNCSKYKAMETNIVRYGVSVASKSEIIKEKVKNTNLEKYGVDNYAKTKECHEKMEATNLQRYGVKSPLQNKDIYIKLTQTVIENYGVDCVSKIKDVREKIKKTNIERYGVDVVSKNNLIKEKIKNTNFERYGGYTLSSPILRDKVLNTLSDVYGVENVSQLEEVKKKKCNTFYNNSTICTSRQQTYINNLYNGELNYPCSYYSLDIALLEDMIDCEIDFGGHDLSVKLGDITQEEFNQKEIIRNQIVKRNGYKTMRIISRKDKLPSDSKLLEILDYSRTYFKENPERSWIEFDIDNSTMRNALCKDNAQHYDFGELRTLPRKSA